MKLAALGKFCKEFLLLLCLLFFVEQGFCGIRFVAMKSVCLSELGEEEVGRGCGIAKSRQQIGSERRCSSICRLQKASLTLVGCVKLFGCFGGGRGS